MKLNFKNFFSHLILHPFSADTKKQKGLALIFSTAFFVFSLSISHIAASLLTRCCKSKLKGAETPTEKKTISVQTKTLPIKNPPAVSRIRDLEKEKETADKLNSLPHTDPLSRLKDPLLRGVNPPTRHLLVQKEVVKTQTNSPTPATLPKKTASPNPVYKKNYNEATMAAFSALFSGSKFTLDELPSYRVVLNSKHPFPKPDQMGDDSVLEGSFDDHRRFVAIQIRFDNSEGQLQDSKLAHLVKKNYGQLSEIRQVLLFAQPYISNSSRLEEPPFQWRQIKGGKLLSSFFEDGDQNSTQKVHLLLKEGKITDSSGLTWELVN